MNYSEESTRNFERFGQHDFFFNKELRLGPTGTNGYGFLYCLGAQSPEGHRNDFGCTWVGFGFMSSRFAAILQFETVL